MRVDMRAADRPLDAQNYRAFIDGEEVTGRCFLADDQMGIVGLYLTDAGGHFYFDVKLDDAAQEIRRGQVTIISPAAEPVVNEAKELIA